MTAMARAWASARTAPSRIGGLVRSRGSARADDPGEWAVAALDSAWGRLSSDDEGPPRILERLWDEHDPEGSVETLKRLIKVELEHRYRRGERPEAAEYLGRFPRLRALPDCALSLIYTEFCLRQQVGEAPDPAAFCDRYPDWRDSLASQLRYHSALSRAAAALPRAQFPEPGGTFAENFRLDGVLGRGGMAVVYLAYEAAFDRNVALKVSPERGTEPRILGRLSHSHIIAVNSLVRDEASGLHGLCMPYLPGLPLDKVVARLGVGSRPPREAKALWRAVAEAVPSADPEAPTDPRWSGFPARRRYADGVAWVGLRLAEALGHAHRAGILHLDVKPANVLLTADGGPQLLDFNLSHASNAVEANVAHRGGTLPYMAPEQLLAFLDEDWSDVGPQSDLYSLGLVLAELLTGQPPMAPEALRAMEPARAIRELLEARRAPRPSIRSRHPGVPHALEAIVDRCLAFSPARRYPDAGALAEDLRRYLDRRPLRHARNPSIVEALGNRLRRPGRGAVALAAAGLLGWRLLAPVPLEVAGPAPSTTATPTPTPTTTTSGAIQRADPGPETEPLREDELVALADAVRSGTPERADRLHAALLRRDSRSRLLALYRAASLAQRLDTARDQREAARFRAEAGEWLEQALRRPGRLASASPAGSWRADDPVGRVGDVASASDAAGAEDARYALARGVAVLEPRAGLAATALIAVDEWLGAWRLARYYGRWAAHDRDVARVIARASWQLSDWERDSSLLNRRAARVALAVDPALREGAFALGTANYLLKDYLAAEAAFALGLSLPADPSAPEDRMTFRRLWLTRSRMRSVWAEDLIAKAAEGRPGPLVAAQARLRGALGDADAARWDNDSADRPLLERHENQVDYVRARTILQGADVIRGLLARAPGPTAARYRLALEESCHEAAAPDLGRAIAYERRFYTMLDGAHTATSLGRAARAKLFSPFVPGMTTAP